VAQWNRTGANDAGVISFAFPVVVFGPNYRPNKVYNAAGMFIDDTHAI